MLSEKFIKVKALIDFFVQPKTFEAEVTFDVTKKINEFLRKVPYDAYVVAEYYAPESSMRWKQNKWTISKEEAWTTDQDILSFLETKSSVCYIEPVWNLI